jgi:macrolide-specific efflux system membrane fusion protein
MNERHGQPWPTYLLGIAAIGAIVAAVLVIGPPSPSNASVRRTVTAQRGVVTSTVSGSGNVEAAKQLDLGFKTSGVVSHIFVSQGQHVVEGQLLAELDPESAEVTLEQSRATLKTAEASLAEEQETDGEGSTSSGGGAGADARASSARTHLGAAPRSHSVSESTTTSTSSTSTLSAASRAANIASASAAVKSDTLAAQSDEEALADTKLYAPTSGTLVALSGEVGETVSATGTTRASTSASSSEGSDSTSTSGLTAASHESSSDTGSTGSSKSSFAVLSDLSSMQLVVPLSESEIGQVKNGQPATVTIEALEGRKLAAEVASISMLPTSNSGVVSYDVTFQLSQLTEGLRPGMSATAEVIVKQAEGVNVPTSAITGGEVTVLQSGKQVGKSVVTGLAGNSTTIVLSGLTAGETVVLPATQTSSSASSLLSRLGSKLGGLGGGAFRGGGGAGFAARAFGG